MNRADQMRRRMRLQGWASTVIGGLFLGFGAVYGVDALRAGNSGLAAAIILMLAVLGLRRVLAGLRLLSAPKGPLGLGMEPAGLLLRWPDLRLTAKFGAMVEERVAMDRLHGWHASEDQVTVLLPRTGLPPLLDQAVRRSAQRSEDGASWALKLPQEPDAETAAEVAAMLRAGAPALERRA